MNNSPENFPEVTQHFLSKQPMSLEEYLRTKIPKVNRDVSDAWKELTSLCLSVPFLYYVAYLLSQTPEVNEVLYTILPSNKTEHRIDLASFPFYTILYVIFYLVMYYPQRYKEIFTEEKEVKELEKILKMNTKTPEVQPLQHDFTIVSQ